MLRVVATALLIVTLFPPRALAQAPRPSAIEVAAAVATCMAERRQTMVVAQGATTWGTLSEDMHAFAIVYPTDDGGMTGEGLPQDDPLHDLDFEIQRERAFHNCFGQEYPRLVAARS